MNTTPKYGLKLPGDNDFYNVGDFNDNFNAIDAALDGVKKYMDEKAQAITPASIGAETPLGAQQRVGALDAKISNYVHDNYLKNSGKLLTNSDLNYVVVPREYHCQEMAEDTKMVNAPVPGPFSLSVYEHASNPGVYQEYRAFDSRVFKRNNYNGTWSPWLRVLDGRDYNRLKTHANTVANQAEENAKKHANDELAKVKQRHQLTHNDGRTIRPSDRNLNNLTTTGFYSGSFTNAPTTNWANVEVFADDTADIMQRLYDMRADKTYTRRHVSGDNWTPWLLVLDGKDYNELKTHANTVANQAETNAKSYVDNKSWQKVRVTDDAGSANIATDLNADLPSGWHMGNNMAHAPGPNWFYVEVIRHNHLYCIQNAYEFGGGTSYYQRKKDNGNWSPWSQNLFKIGEPKHLPPNSNLNDIMEPGDYYNLANVEVATMANVPVALSFSLSVYKHAGVHQEFRVYDPGNSQVYKRNFYAGAWSQWLQVLDQRHYHELKQSGVELKNKLAGVINAKGVQASANDTFDQLAAKVGEITALYAGGTTSRSGDGLITVSGLSFRPKFVRFSGADRDNYKRMYIGMLWDNAVSGYYGITSNSLFKDGVGGGGSGRSFRENQITDDGFALYFYEIGYHVNWEVWGWR